MYKTLLSLFLLLSLYAVPAQNKTSRKHSPEQASRLIDIVVRNPDADIWQCGRNGMSVTEIIEEKDKARETVVNLIKKNWSMHTSEKFWNKQANGYNREEMKAPGVRNKILESVKQYLQKNDTVLDHGCATGILANEIAADVHSVCGIDISAEMIRIAQGEASARGIQNAQYTHSTIFDEKLKAGTFDVILCIYILHLLENMPGELKRIHELLKPGGLFISVTPCLGKKSLAGIGLSLISKMGLIPRLQLFNLRDLEEFITNTDLTILETACLDQKGQQYFIVAKKVSWSLKLI